MLPLVRDLQPLLKTDRFGRTLRGHDALPSTNTAAAAWAADGAPEGSLVVAEYQTAGRGRLGRTWEAARGVNLMCSLVLRPRLAADRLGLVALAAGVAVAEAVESFTTPLTPRLKWPNDVLLEGKKCCGMLLESSLQGGKATIVLGIGLNVNQTHFPPELAHRATSLLLATGRHISRPALLARLLERLEYWYDALHDGSASALRSAYTDRLTDLGRRVDLRSTADGQPVRGIFTGITETGALRLDTGAGLQTFTAGELTSHAGD